MRGALWVQIGDAGRSRAAAGARATDHEGALGLRRLLRRRLLTHVMARALTTGRSAVARQMGLRDMARDEHVRIAAQHMIDRYQNSALAEADQRVQELKDRGEERAARDWLEIRNAVARLMATPPPKRRH